MDNERKVVYIEEYREKLRSETKRPLAESFKKHANVILGIGILGTISWGLTIGPTVLAYSDSDVLNGIALASLGVIGLSAGVTGIYFARKYLAPKIGNLYGELNEVTRQHFH